MLNQINNMVRELNNGVSDERLEVIDNFYQSVNVETLNTYQALAFYELDRLLWVAYAM